jgi:hypothetical protein
MAEDILVGGASDVFLDLCGQIRVFQLVRKVRNRMKLFVQLKHISVQGNSIHLAR